MITGHCKQRWLRSQLLHPFPKWMKNLIVQAGKLIRLALLDEIAGEENNVPRTSMLVNHL